MINPFHSAWSGHNEVILSIVDQDGESLAEEEWNSICLSLHEIGPEGVVDIICLAVIDDIWVESIDGGWDISISEVGL